MMKFDMTRNDDRAHRGCSIPAADIINLDSALDTGTYIFTGQYVSRQLASGQLLKTITN